MKRSTIMARVPTSLRKKLERLADQDQRSLSAYVRIILERHVSEQSRG